MASTALESTSPHDWRYTAEGGANLVLSFVGARGPFTGKLLRLRKKKLAYATGLIPDEVDVEFGRRIIKPLLGEEQIVDMERVAVSKGWLVALKAALSGSEARPAHRAAEDEVDEDAGVVVLAEDLVHGEGVMAIEIKPKWGFLPSATYLSSSSRDIKTTYCRFCMHSYMKKAKSNPALAIEEHQEGYCPLDLYSGDDRRIGRAVEALWRAWELSEGAANNLRFFYEGVRVEPEEPASVAHLHSFLTGVSPLPSPIHSPSASPLPFTSSPYTLSLLVSILVPILLASPLLATLATLQASLDPLDIEGVSSQLGLHLDDDSQPPSPLLSSQPTLQEWIAWLAGRETAEAADSSSTDHRSVLLSYLLSATFKDCSIFIRLAPKPKGAALLGDASTSLNFSASVKAIDLDPKPLSRLPKYYDLDRRIVEAWKTMLEERGAEGIRKCAEGV
ncbi:inositol-pentakisphosphate 2-kinase [Leucosporidium creatinivorum]|uniref:Inositol-pentakisphosphate 2-kinase n=1 Tax=Leucosporidium creatinivorum TaxID=106004 RepID=A0A1Y2F790_9BASI|nr:inositol-pentakisphosphate 2-kinase [Leucosporidium creatinivorum]